MTDPRPLSALPVLAALALPCGASAPLTPQQTLRCSLGPAGAEANGGSSGPAVSPDGRYVAFASAATNLVPGDTNGVSDVFLRDLWTGTTARASVATGGAQASGYCVGASVSADGRRVAFESYAPNLAPDDFNGELDVFVHDFQTGITQRASVDSAGDGGDQQSYTGLLSADGRYVAFTSEARLHPMDQNDGSDVYVRDLQTGVTLVVSIAHATQLATGLAAVNSISADGTRIAFTSGSSALVPGDLNGQPDVFVHDKTTGQIHLVSRSSSGAQGDAGSSQAQLSADGGTAAFRSLATNLVPGDTNDTSDIFVHDIARGTTERVSVGTFGAESDAFNTEPALSADGQTVAFVSLAGNLVPGDEAGHKDVFVHDRRTGRLVRASVGTSGAEADFLSGTPTLTADGRGVFFSSGASNLVPGDTNGTGDIFLRERGPGDVVAYCEAKQNSQGCVPTLSWSGAPSATAGGGFVITAVDLLNQQSGLFAYGLEGPAAIPFQGGTLCVQPTIRRTPVQGTGGNPPPADCSGQLAFDFNAWIASGADAALAPGRTVACQVWSRDPQEPFGSSLSDALEFTIGP